MNKLWQTSGRVAFWVSWPLLWFYLRIGRRTRVIIACGDEIVVTKGWLGNGRWALPGGGIHSEETAEEGAIREIREETGLDLKKEQLKPLGAAVASSYGLGFQYDQFVTEVPDQLTLKPQRFEITDARWIAIGELNDKNAENVTLAVIGTWKNRGE